MSGCHRLAIRRRASWTARLSKGGSNSRRSTACSMSSTCGMTLLRYRAAGNTGVPSALVVLPAGRPLHSSPGRHLRTPEPLVPPTHDDPPVVGGTERRADPRRTAYYPPARRLCHSPNSGFPASWKPETPQLRPGPDCARTGVRTKLLAVIVWIALVVWLGLVIWSLSVVRAAAGADAPATPRTKAAASGVPLGGRRRVMIIGQSVLLVVALAATIYV